MDFGEFKQEDLGLKINRDNMSRAFLPSGYYGRTGLLNLPPEVFSCICGFLESAWLYNLGRVCQQTRLYLSFESGNKLWYNSLPLSLWKEAAIFQHGFKDDSKMVSNTSLKPHIPHRSGDPSRLSSLYSLQTSSIENYQTTSQLSMSTDVSASPSLSQQDDGPLAHTRPILAVPALTGYFNALHPMNPEHERVQALGGPYQSSCDYRAEILGHMKTNQRCFICLCIRNSAGAPVDSKPHRQWGILFCSGCLKDYSIAAGIVRKVVPVAGILDSTSLPSFTTGSTQYYYLPEVDEILRSHTGLDVKIALMSHNRVLQQKEKARVQASNLERQRRIIRQQIVLFAQRLWEGEDPAPEEVIDVRTGKVIAFEPRKTLTSPELYQCFRERFAPTAKLKEFLFPEHLLDIRPTDLPYNPLGGWLQDPTKKLRSFVTADNMSNRYVSDCAEKMLHCLTNWRDPLYYRKGMGGYVDSWMNAAKQYHINRLEAELASGLTVNMGYIPTDCHGNSQFARLRRLRAKCGLQKLDSVHMDQVPKRPEREPLSASYPLYEYIRRDQAVARAETKRAEGIKYFNKIIRETTTTCPSTALLFYPMGLEGLVEHMRVGHGDVFWQSDDFHIVG